MHPSFPVMGAKHYGRITQNAGTVIVRMIEPRKNLFTILEKAEVTTAATAHLLSVMRPLGRTTISSSAAASQAVVNITADPGDYSSVGTADNGIAANDYVVYKCDDGTFVVDVVSSVATLAITLTNNVPYVASAGNPFWFFGVYTNVNPADALANPIFTLKANSTNQFSSATCGFAASYQVYDPLLLYIDNGTNASTLEFVEAVYSNRGGLSAA